MPSNYYGIDIDKESLALLKQDYPTSNTFHYNRKNVLYNPNGNENELPIVHQTFSTIVSYSVFTQMTFEDKIELILHLIKNNLQSQGQLAFTFCNPDREKCKQFFYHSRKSQPDLTTKDFIYFVNNYATKFNPVGDVKQFVAFYKREFLEYLFSDYDITFVDSPVGWVQDVMIIRK